MNDRPAMVISLDFELHWGVRDVVGLDSPYVANLLGARTAIPHILALFRQYDISATWATVGLLFASSRAHQEALSPDVRPTYARPGLSPFAERVGRDEQEDPLHFGLSLIRQIASTPGQEIGSHTYSHFYCLEPGQTLEQFRADLQAAQRAASTLGLELRSLVFPRNQCNGDYLSCLSEVGIRCYRGCERNWGHKYPVGAWGLLQRVFRYVDSFWDLTGPNLATWNAVRQGPPHNIPASRFLRPVHSVSWLNRLQLRRLRGCLQAAAAGNQIFHLWWHPHNFGTRTQENLDFLKELLDCFAECRQRYGMQSLSMGELVQKVS